MATTLNTRQADTDRSGGAERRIYPRFGVPRCHVYSDGDRMHLLNLGRSGMAIESFGRCSFSRSENHRFVLDDELHSIEVLGNVSWVSSFWVNDASVPGTGLVQTVGVSFREVISAYPIGLWRGIESLGPPSTHSDRDLVPAAESPAISARPAATMDKPRDGSVTASRFITVEGYFRDPGSTESMTINGIEASIEDDRFSARIHLTQDVNYLCAVVSHFNTIDSTCFLGKVLRELPHESSDTQLRESAHLQDDLERAADVLVLPELPED